MEIYNKRLREMRIANNFKIKEAAEMVGVTEATMQRYETGNGIKRVPYCVITKLAEKYGCTPEYIMGWEKKSEISYSTKNANIIIEVTDELNRSKSQERLLAYIKAFNKLNEKYQETIMENIDYLLDKQEKGL